MATVTVNTIDSFSGIKAWDLDVGTNYTVKCDAYGIIVIEDTMRLYHGKEIGTFRDGKLSFIASGGAFDIQFGDPVKRMDTDFKMAYLVTSGIAGGDGEVTMSVPDN